MAVIGASPGGFGTVLAQNAWLPVLRTLRMRPWFGGGLLVSRAAQVFNTGELMDETVREQLREFLRGFVQVDAARRTAEPAIYAIGDVAGEPIGLMGLTNPISPIGPISPIHKE